MSIVADNFANYRGDKDFEKFFCGKEKSLPHRQGQFFSAAVETCLINNRRLLPPDVRRCY